MKPLLVSSGEPAGIGPDLCLDLVGSPYPVVILADPVLLSSRARVLGRAVKIHEYQEGISPSADPNILSVLPVEGLASLEPGVLTVNNVPYVMNMLTQGVERCLAGQFSGLVTAPIHKEIINQGGIPFTGHTEFIAQKCHVRNVVMMLASEVMKVALMTTHLPLREVPNAITTKRITEVIHCINRAIKQDFGCVTPRILVAGLNPHAGEGGYLGREEIETITPTLLALRQEGILVEGPFAADTLFNEDHLKKADVFVSMYHDQGLSVLKYASFGHAVNISLGLPIIRTSVDHGTALALAGSGQAISTSLIAAITMAAKMAHYRQKYHD